MDALNASRYGYGYFQKYADMDTYILLSCQKKYLDTDADTLEVSMDVKCILCILFCVDLE